MSSHFFALGSARVQLTIDGPLESLSSILPRYRVSQDEWESAVGAAPERYRAFQARGSWWLSLNDGPPDPIEPSGDPVPGLEYLVAYRLLTGLPYHLHLHAGGVERDGKVLLVLGTSGSGKSSLTWALAHRGLRVLSDDVVLMGIEGALPFHRWLKLSETVLLEAEGPSLPGIPVGEGERRLDVDQLPGGWSEGGEITHIALVSWGDDSDDTLLDEVDRIQLLRDLLNAALPDGVSGAEAFARLAPVAERVQAGFLSFSDCHEGARILDEWMKETSPV